MVKWMLLVACLASIPVGCSSNVALSKAGPEQLKAASTSKLCDLYGFSNQSRAIDELRRRGAFDDDELSSIAAHAMKIGMPEEVANCSWGDEYYSFSVADADGTKVKRRTYWMTRRHVFVKNGLVTGYD